jgi:hypothetical protein
MADGTLKVGTITTSSGSGNITIGSGVTVNVNRPSFYSYLNTTQSISDSTDTTVQMAAELWDTDSAFDTSTYKFTNEDEARAMIYKNSSTRLTASRYFQGQNGTINYQCGVAADLSVGDTVEFKTRQVSGGAKNAEGTFDVSYFLGYKLGA